MPSDTVKSMADKANISVEKAEEKWKEAKEKAAEEGHEEDWPYVMSIFKKMIGLNEAEDERARLSKSAPFIIYVRDSQRKELRNIFRKLGIKMADWGERLYNETETNDFWANIDPNSKRGQRLKKALERADISFKIQHQESEELVNFKEFLREKRLEKYNERL